MELTSNVTLLSLGAAELCHACPIQLRHAECHRIAFRGAGVSPAIFLTTTRRKTAGETPALQHHAQRSNCDIRASRFDSSTIRSGVFAENPSTSSKA
jgi:hypothetical protein